MNNSPSHSLIIDTDPGVDDAMAIALACAHPQIELLGLTTVFGNVSVELATRNALSILQQFGFPGIPVAKGAAVPLQQVPLQHPDFVHGKDGLGNIDLPAPDGRAHASDAADFIIEQASARPGRITLVAVGPLTNVAVALQRDPKLPQKLEKLVVMGGALDEPGNVSPVAEANFLGDPHAADQVFAVEWPATIVGLDVTHKVLLFDSDMDVLQQRSSTYGDLLRRSSRFYIDFYTSTGAARDYPEPGCAMHDAAAVVCAIHPELFDTVSGGVRVIEDGVAAGQLTMNRKDYRYLLDHWHGRPPAAACMDVQIEAVKTCFINSLCD